MDVTAIPQVQAFDPATLKHNPAIRARSGEPKKDKVDWLANNMFERRSAGQIHQIQPGIVRVLDNGDVEIIVGDHRRAAEVKLNENLSEGDDKFMFLAIAFPASDKQALLDAIDENEYRNAATVFDKGEAWAKLVDMGMTQAEVANRYGVGESTVSDYIKAAKLPKKIKALVDSDKLDAEGAIALARYNKDVKLQEELLALSLQETEAREAIIKRADARSKGEPEPAAAEPTATGGGKKSKSAGSAPTSDAVKSKPSRKTATGKTTAADVKTAIKKKGVQKKQTANHKSFRDFVQLLTALFGPDVEDVPEPYAELAAAIEEYYDDNLGDQAFKNRWVKAVKTKY